VNLVTAALRTIEDPRKAAEWIIGQNLPLVTASLALVLIGVLTSLLSGLLLMIAPDPLFPYGPFALAAVQVVGLFTIAGLIKIVGGWCGGGGRFADAVALLAWLQTVMFLLQLAQVATLFILPPVAFLLALFGLGVLILLLLHFIAVLHGFSSLFRVFLGILATLFSLALGIVVVLGV
jgi:hypothetical protein